ncbi:MAG TPA: hypothetical protein VIK84_04880, partial [Haloplasmataceae bacterium]
MACINPQNPQFQEILKRQPNPLLAELEYDRLYGQSSPSPSQGVSELFESNPELASIGTPEQYSQYLESLNNPNTNPILQGNQEEQVKKFNELQERLNNKEFLEGAKNAFESSEELQKLGTQEQYNDYIARVSLGIIKNPTSGEYNYESKVRDIVYHGSPKTKLEKIEGISFWTNEIGNAYSYNIQRNEDNSEGFVTSAIVNIKNPYIHQEDVNSRFATTTPKDLIDTAKSKNADGAIWKDVEDIGGKETQTIVFEPEQIHILSSKADIQGFKEFVDSNQSNVQYQLPQGREIEEFVASEKTIRDLAARMSDRIGIPVRYISDRSQQFKGKLENGIAVINLAYATLDTPIHEILGHPIIRAIKNGTELSNFKYEIKELNDPNAPFKFQVETYSDENLGDVNFFDTREEAEEYVKSLKLSQPKTQLYQNLLKELEYGKGKEVFDRIKRDYVYKEGKSRSHIVTQEDHNAGKFLDSEVGSEIGIAELYTLEEQQEEAIVELLGLMVADRLDKVKDGKLISLLKQLLKEIKAFMKQLLGQKEVEIDKLPDNMTLGDIADLLAYSNSKLILPGNEVIYTTPDNQQFKTYAEASKHISDLAKSIEDVDLSDIKVDKPINDISQIDKDYWRDTVSDRWNSRVFIKRADGSFYVSGHTYEDFTQEQIDAIKNEKGGISAKPD